MTTRVYSGAILQKTVVNVSAIKNQTADQKGSGDCNVCRSGDKVACYTVSMGSNVAPGGCSYTNSEGCNIGSDDESNCYYNGSLEDWHFTSDDTCTLGLGGKTPQCSTVDSSYCVLIADGKTFVDKSNNTYSTACNDVRIPCSTGGFVAGESLTTSWFTSAEKENYVTKGRNIKCDYNSNVFVDSLPRIQSYYNKFVNTANTNDFSTNVLDFNNSNYNVMMQDFASGISTDADAKCPSYINYPYVNVTPKTCSRFIATGAQANWTTEWAGGNQTTNNVVPYTDNAKNTYCTNYPDSPECACINRVNVDPGYSYLQSVVGLPPQCWYSPCQSGAGYLLTSDLADFSVCPDNICQQVNQNVSQNGGVITSQQQQNMECTVATSDTDADADVTIPSPIDTTTGGIPTWLWIALIAGGGIIILVIIILLVMSSKKKDKKK